MSKKMIYIVIVAAVVVIYLYFFKEPTEPPTDVRADILETSYEIMTEILVYSSPYEPFSDEEYEQYNQFINNYSAEKTVNEPLNESEQRILYHLKGLIYYAQHFRVAYQQCGQCYTEKAQEYLEKMVAEELELFRIYGVDAAQFYGN